MVDFDVNYWAVLVAAVASMLLGWVYYGPLFGKAWMKMTGMTEEKAKKGSGKAMGLAAVSALVTAFVMAVVIPLFGAVEWAEGLQVGFWMWLGFSATVTAMNYAFEQRRTHLWLLNNGYTLVNYLIMAVILTVWV